MRRGVRESPLSPQATRRGGGDLGEGAHYVTEGIQGRGHAP